MAEEMLSQSVMDALMNAQPENLIAPNQNPETIKGGANRSGGWMHAPARLELFAAADQRLARIAAKGEVTRNKVERVHCRLVPGTKLLIIKPAPSNDLSALEVTRYAKGSSAWINLFSLLEEAGLALETGYRQRYDAPYIPKASPLAPGLVIDLNKPLERRAEPARKSKAKKALTGAQPTEAAKAAEAQ